MSEQRVGLLTKDQEAFFAELLDEAIPFKNKILEGLDRPAFKLIISNIDNLAAEKIPQDWQNPLEPIIDACVEQSWQEAGVMASHLVAAKIEIPGLDDESEFAIINGVIQLILGAIIAKAAAVK